MITDAMIIKESGQYDKEAIQRLRLERLCKSLRSFFLNAKPFFIFFCFNHGKPYIEYAILRCAHP